MPATTNTRRVIRRELYNHVPYLGFYGTADNVATTYVEDTYAFQDSNLSADTYRGAYIYRPDLSTDDMVKKAGTLTVASGRLAQTGTVYSDTGASKMYEVVGHMHPDDLNAAIQRALQKVYFETQSPLSLLTDSATEGSTAGDGDMSAVGTSSWTTVGTLTTKEKVTDTHLVYSGIKAFHFLTNATSSGIKTIALKANSSSTAKSRAFVSTVFLALTGNVTVQLYDETNAAVVNSYTSDYRGWTRIWIDEELPATCDSWSVRIINDTSAAHVYVDHVVANRRQDLRLFAPSWLNEAHKFLKLREARYMRNLADHVDDANSRIFQDWLQPQMFSLDPFNPEVNPFAVQMNKPQPQADLWIEAKRPYYDIETLAADTDTTTAPLHLVLAYAKREIADILVKRYPSDERWTTLQKEAAIEARAQVTSRPEVPRQPIRLNVQGRI